MAKPDYAYWDLQPEYSRQTAPWLCCDLEPRNPTPGDPKPPKVRDMEANLTRAFRADHVLVPAAYTRTDLRAWADRTGRRVAMPFLFPEDRKQAEPPVDSAGKTNEPDEPKIDRRREKTLLRIIGALLDLAKIDDHMAPKKAAHAVNGCLQRLGANSMKDDTVANVIKAARDLIVNDRESGAR